MYFNGDSISHRVTEEATNAKINTDNLNFFTCSPLLKRFVAEGS